MRSRALPQASLASLGFRLPPTEGGARGLVEPDPRPLLDEVVRALELPAYMIIVGRCHGP